ncbi:MAG: hypothetical protein BWY23_02748 [Spirochaetes bacterium ADurb.Bin218]|nr:MAG: hypothetical protein BWY23_02748 [Spirochaetes bacterium ADurb.Bin218]
MNFFKESDLNSFSASLYSFPSPDKRSKEIRSERALYPSAAAIKTLHELLSNIIVCRVLSFTIVELRDPVNFLYFARS